MRRRLAAIALVTVALGAVYMLWFRDSSLVQVKRVQVVGLSTAPDAARLRAQLTAAAERMTTLHLDAGELHKVVANDPVVRSISLRPDFPHGLTIDVTENRPVALVTVGAKSVPVAADGTVLEGVDTSGSLPEIRTVAMPGGRRVDRGAVL